VQIKLLCIRSTKMAKMKTVILAFFATKQIIQKKVKYSYFNNSIYYNRVVGSSFVNTIITFITQLCRQRALYGKSLTFQQCDVMYFCKVNSKVLLSTFWQNVIVILFMG